MKKQVSALRKSGFMLAVSAILALVINMALPGCQQEDLTMDDLSLKSAVLPELKLTYEDEVCAGEDFTIGFVSTCGKVKIERGYINGDPIMEGELIVGYEKIYAGLTCDTENLQWEAIGNDEFLSCTGGTITGNWLEMGTYVYRAKLNQKAYKNSECPDCSNFKGNLFECFMITVTECGSVTFTDSRDQKVYKFVEICDQVWMAENLAFKTETGSWAYNNDESKVAIYGRLYDWATAVTACPEGWHLPSDAEWDQLAQYVSDQKGPYAKSDNFWYYVGQHLKATGTIEDNDGLWLFYDTSVEGTDDFGFSALPGGARSGGGNFFSMGEAGVWWTSSESSDTHSWRRLLFYGYPELVRSFHPKVNGYSVRCVRN